MNYTDLFRATLPETALEIAALLVLIVDLGLLRKSALKMRVTIAALLGVAGCGAAHAAQPQPQVHGHGYVGSGAGLVRFGIARRIHRF